IPALLGPGSRRRWPGLAFAAVLLALHPLYGYVRLAGAPEAERFVNVRIVQPSIDQSMKWDHDERARIFDTYLRMSAAPARSDRPAAQLILWPETSVPFLLTE